MHCSNDACIVAIVSLCNSQKGDSAVIIATAKRSSGVLHELVTAGAELNLQNEVR